MNIRQATPADRAILFDIWLRSVRATHDFVSEEDIESFMPIVREYLASTETEFLVVSSDADAVMGFMGLAGEEIESLFVDPQFHRQGGGRRLVEHAVRRGGELTVSVNEQNAGAVRFYKACGFVVEGRSETDGMGRPYPQLLMRRARA